METIQSLKEKFKECNFFGVEKDKSFHSSIGQIYQTWDGQELYPSVEEKAAMLLYLVVKNHSFVDVINYNRFCSFFINGSFSDAVSKLC